MMQHLQIRTLLEAEEGSRHLPQKGAHITYGDFTIFLKLSEKMNGYLWERIWGHVALK